MKTLTLALFLTAGIAGAHAQIDNTGTSPNQNSSPTIENTTPRNPDNNGTANDGVIKNGSQNNSTGGSQNTGGSEKKNTTTNPEYKTDPRNENETPNTPNPAGKTTTPGKSTTPNSTTTPNNKKSTSPGTSTPATPNSSQPMVK